MEKNFAQLNSDHILVGGGEMVVLMRALDWSKPPELATLTIRIQNHSKMEKSLGVELGLASK